MTAPCCPGNLSRQPSQPTTAGATEARDITTNTDHIRRPSYTGVAQDRSLRAVKRVRNEMRALRMPAPVKPRLYPSPR